MPQLERTPSARRPIESSEPETSKDDIALRITSNDSSTPMVDASARDAHDAPQYRRYKRRFFGLAQLVLLNIIVSWDWLTFAAVSTTSSRFFGVTVNDINWLSTAFLFAFAPVAPLVIWTLNKGGPKYSILIASALVLVGNWIRYGGTRASPPRFGVVVFGQILIGFSQPFVLAAPPRYSNLWFSDTGRVTATAVASLANPLGGALGQLIGPIWATDEKGIPNLVLYTAILSTAATLPAPFIPKAPPTPPSATAASEKLDLRAGMRALSKNIAFYLILIPFSIYVGFFNASSSLINQILGPYGYSETNAGIAGGLLIVVGLVAAAIVSPIVDRKQNYTFLVKIFVPIIAACYLVLIWMPQTRSLAGPFTVFSILGASSFSLLPMALEYLVLVTHPVPPEISSTISWTLGQLLGAIFIIIMDALRGGIAGQPVGSLVRALIFEAVIAIIVVPFPMFLETRWVNGIRNRAGLRSAT